MQSNSCSDRIPQESCSDTHQCWQVHKCFTLTQAACLQAILITNHSSLPSQSPATQTQLRKVCTSHLLAAARFASFARQAELLGCAVKAFWNTTVELVGSAQGRSLVTEGLEELADLMCRLKLPDSDFQVWYLLS